MKSLNNYEEFKNNPKPAFEKLLDSLIKFILDSNPIKYIPENSSIFNDAYFLCQKSFLHAFSLNELMKESSFNSELLKKEVRFIDPISMVALLRAQFETYVAFNHIYINPESKEELEIRYKCWKLSGLKYQSKYKPKQNDPNRQKHEAKLKEESKVMDNLLKEIMKNEFFRQMPKKVQERIKKRCRWKFSFKDKKSLNWEEMFFRTGFKKEVFNQSYNLLSFYSHPTYISVIQLKSMFNNGYYKVISNNALMFSCILIAFLIFDYIKLFPKCRIVYNKLPEEHQVLITFFNETFRIIKFRKK